MKTLSEILIKVAKDPSSVNKIAAWDELVKNKKRYPLAQLEFAKEYLGVITHDELKDVMEYKARTNLTLEPTKLITYQDRMDVAGVNASEAAIKLRKAIESCMLNDKKDSFLVKIVKKLTKMVEKLNQRLNSNRWRIYYWFYKK